MHDVRTLIPLVMQCDAPILSTDTDMLSIITVRETDRQTDRQSRVASHRVTMSANCTHSLTFLRVPLQFLYVLYIVMCAPTFFTFYCYCYRCTSVWHKLSLTLHHFVIHQNIKFYTIKQYHCWNRKYPKNNFKLFFNFQFDKNWKKHIFISQFFLNFRTQDLQNSYLILNSYLTVEVSTLLTCFGHKCCKILWIRLFI